MRRYYIKVGDKTTSGATVIEGMSGASHHGVPLSFIGAKIYCPTCKSDGVIMPQGPRRPDNWMGKQSALDNDFGMCACQPVPVLIASQNNMSMSFEVHELARMGFFCDRGKARWGIGRRECRSACAFGCGYGRRGRSVAHAARQWGGGLFLSGRVEGSYRCTSRVLRSRQTGVAFSRKTDAGGFPERRAHISDGIRRNRRRQDGSDLRPDANTCGRRADDRPDATGGSA